MGVVGIFYGHLVYFTAILVYFMAVWYGLCQIWYIFPILVVFDRKNLATLSDRVGAEIEVKKWSRALLNFFMLKSQVRGNSTKRKSCGSWLPDVIFSYPKRPNFDVFGESLGVENFGNFVAIWYILRLIGIF
jgi:hypothetical protein